MGMDSKADKSGSLVYFPCARKNAPTPQGLSSVRQEGNSVKIVYPKGRAGWNGIAVARPNGYRVKDLIALLEEDDEEAKIVAACSLVQIGDESGLTALVGAISEGKIRDAQEIPFLLFIIALSREDLIFPLLAHPEKPIKLYALNALVRTNRRGLAKRLLPLLDSDDPDIRMMTAEGLGLLKCGEAKGRLLALLSDADWQVRARAMEALRALRAEARKFRRAQTARRPRRRNPPQ